MLSKGLWLFAEGTDDELGISSSKPKSNESKVLMLVLPVRSRIHISVTC